MRTFTDALHRHWEIVIDFFTIEKVKSRLGVNLLDLHKAIEELFSDPPKLVNALYLLCHDQTEGKVTERDFCKGINGDVLDKARDAFIEEMVFFCPTAAKETLQRAMALSKEVSEKTVKLLEEQARKRMETVNTDDLAITATREWMRETLSESRGNSPDKSELIPAG